MKEIVKKHIASSVEEHPAVYVGTYAKYNDGSLYGAWLDLSSFEDYEEFLEVCKALHSDEEDPEFMFQDYEFFPRRWYSESGLGEHFDDILAFADCSNKDAAYIFIDDLGFDSLDKFDESYQGEWDSKVDFAWNIFDEFYSSEMPEFARRYFDIEAFARDLFIDDYTFAEGFVFARYV